MPRTRIRPLIAWLAIGLTLSRGVQAQSQDGGLARARPEDVGMSSARLSEAMDSVRAWSARERIQGGIILVIRHGKLVFHEAAGWSDRERQIALRTDHVVSMRSMTKPLVGVAVLMLREEGKLALEDRYRSTCPPSTTSARATSRSSSCSRIRRALPAHSTQTRAVPRSSRCARRSIRWV